MEIGRLSEMTGQLDGVICKLGETLAKLDKRKDSLTETMETLAQVVAQNRQKMAQVAVERDRKIAEDFASLDRKLELYTKLSIERDERLGERIGALVSAIGEFIHNRPSTG